MTYAPVGWGVSVVICYAVMSNHMALASPSILESLQWVWPLFGSINGVALLLFRYTSSLPGRYLPLPHKHFWLATPTRQEHYFKVTVTVVWTVAALLSMGVTSLVIGLTGSGTTTALGAIGFLGTTVVALCFALFWPTKRLRPGAQRRRNPVGQYPMGTAQAYTKRDLE